MLIRKFQVDLLEETEPVGDDSLSRHSLPCGVDHCYGLTKGLEQVKTYEESCEARFQLLEQQLRPHLVEQRLYLLAPSPLHHRPLQNTILLHVLLEISATNKTNNL